MTTSTDSIAREWRLKLLIFWNCIGILLFASYFTPLWESIDLSLFRLINEPLKNSHALRVFWALANHNLADWFEDICFLAFYAVGIWKTKQGHRVEKTAQFLFSIILTAITILFVNRFLCHDVLRLRRASPTLALPDAVYLKDFLTGISMKVISNKSFPGDHATTALMITISYAYIMRGKLAIFALLYGLFLCLPRLAVGAHWPSDLIVGSGCITLFVLTWAYCTPFASTCLKHMIQALRRVNLIRISKNKKI